MSKKKKFKAKPIADEPKLDEPVDTTVEKTSDKSIDQQEELLKLYRSDNDHTTIDMTKLDKAKTRSRTRSIFLTVIGTLSVVALILGYIVLGPDRSAIDSTAVAIALTTPATVASGETVSLDITYTNNNSVAIDNGQIELVVPSGFYIQSSDPQPAGTSTNKWVVSNVPAGTGGTIHLTGQVVGQIGDVKDFTVLFTYRPTNFNSDFQVSNHTTTQVTESIVGLSVSTPEQARTGENITLQYTITNDATLPLTNVQVNVTYPTGFVPTSAEPVANQSNRTWELEQLDPAETYTVTIKGDITAEDDTAANFIFQAGLTEPDGFFNVQAEVTKTITVINPAVRLSLSAPQTAAAGEAVTYAITLENISSVTLTAIQLQLDFSDGVVDTKTIALETIDTLPANAKTELSHTITLKADPGEATALTATLSIAQAQVDTTSIEFADEATATTTLQGSAVIETAARYYDDDLTKLGSGPIPPQVGETTTYSIYWVVAAAGSTLTDLNITATLPEGVTSTSTDDVTYDATTNTVKAQLDSLSPDSPQTLEFQVTVTPKKKDLNKLLVLVDETVLTALDSNTQKAIQAQADRVTSKLTTDPGVTDDGVVVE